MEGRWIKWNVCDGGGCFGTLVDKVKCKSLAGDRNGNQTEGTFLGQSLKNVAYMWTTPYRRVLLYSDIHAVLSSERSVFITLWKVLTVLVFCSLECLRKHYDDLKVRETILVLSVNI